MLLLAKVRRVPLGSPQILICGESESTAKIHTSDVSRVVLSRSSREVIRSGFEPETHSLEGCCSIQLSYRTAPNGAQKACPLGQKSAQRYNFFLNYARKK